MITSLALWSVVWSVFCGGICTQRLSCQDPSGVVLRAQITYYTSVIAPSLQAASKRREGNRKKKKRKKAPRKERTDYEVDHNQPPHESNFSTSIRPRQFLRLISHRPEWCVCLFLFFRLAP